VHANLGFVGIFVFKLKPCKGHKDEQTSKTPNTAYEDTYITDCLHIFDIQGNTDTTNKYRVSNVCGRTSPTAVANMLTIFS